MQGYNWRMFEDPAWFATIYRLCEGVYGRGATALDVERAHARYRTICKREANA